MDGESSLTTAKTLAKRPLCNTLGTDNPSSSSSSTALLAVCPLRFDSFAPPVSMSIRLKATTNSSSVGAKPRRDSQGESVASSFATIKLRGMPIHVVTREEVVNHIVDCSAENTGGWVVTPNLDILRRHARSTSFRNLVATSTLNVPDGMPLVWACLLYTSPSPRDS